MIIGKLDADGLKIKEIDISDNELIFLRSLQKSIQIRSCINKQGTLLFKMFLWQYLDRCLIKNVMYSIMIDY